MIQIEIHQILVHVSPEHGAKKSNIPRVAEPQQIQHRRGNLAARLGAAPDPVD
jgi:hypothetical protein